MQETIRSRILLLIYQVKRGISERKREKERLRDGAGSRAGMKKKIPPAAEQRKTKEIEKKGGGGVKEVVCICSKNMQDPSTEQARPAKGGATGLLSLEDEPLLRQLAGAARAQSDGWGSLAASQHAFRWVKKTERKCF